MNPRPRFRELTADSIKYWEPRRIFYNAVLAIIVVGYFAAAWPASKAIISLNSILILFLLTVLANICYCAVYVIDVFVQLSGLEISGFADAGFCSSWGRLSPLSWRDSSQWRRFPNLLTPRGLQSAPKQHLSGIAGPRGIYQNQ